MLDASTSVILNVLLDLRLALSVGRLIDWHLDNFVEVSNDNRAKR